MAVYNKNLSGQNDFVVKQGLRGIVDKTGGKNAELSFQCLGKTGVMVAIPAYNEEVAIGSVVLRAKKYADKVVVVDDGSRDGTAEVARMAGAEVISHKTNKGYGAAIKTCFETAKANDIDAMVIIDADGQHNPDDIPVLIEEMNKNQSDIVIGSRFINDNDKKQNIPTLLKNWNESP